MTTLQVKGERLDVDSSIRTRSRAKQQAEQWQMVPLPAKLIALLADAFAESSKTGQRAAGAQAVLMHCNQLQAGMLQLVQLVAVLSPAPTS